ncbi:MAG: UxaA family hydrolase [Deltaproteobacteria bacterium]|nr:UxaA family hydrolase [Deltaproteobacteria bacterium]
MKSEPEPASDFAVLEGYGPSTFLGFTRPKGAAGIRNHLLVLPSVACACGVARAIGRTLPEAVILEHGHGCGRGGKDWQRTLDLAGHRHQSERRRCAGGGAGL